jgi:hypothetical protein
MSDSQGTAGLPAQRQGTISSSPGSATSDFFHSPPPAIEADEPVDSRSAWLPLLAGGALVVLLASGVAAAFLYGG